MALLPAQASLLIQDVKELSVPIEHFTAWNVPPAAINTNASLGYRLVDLQYTGTSGSTPLFTGCFVRSLGPYATSWWWYHGLTSSQVSSYLTTNNARLIDLEPYIDPNGALRFACIMVDNTGVNNKAWWWYIGFTTSNISTQLAANNARLVDLDSYTLNGTTYYSAVMIRNTGNDQRSWWWYTDAASSQVASFATLNQARVYGLERRNNGNWDCILIRDTTPTVARWAPDLTSSDLAEFLANGGLRPIEILQYALGGAPRYAVVAINNSNALTTYVGQLMRNATNGKIGCWLQQINGGNLASLRSTTRIEPASAIKVLHHVHAVRKVHEVSISMATPINVFTNYSTTNASCPIDTGPVSEQLHAVLRAMMEASDNARTQAITARFGQLGINATAAALGMPDTSLNHRIGCHSQAIANPNRTTLADLHALHTAVAGGYLGGLRDTFYDLMLQSLSGLGIDAVIDAEGAALNLPAATVASFRTYTRLARKGGNYAVTPALTMLYHRAEFGWISLPFISSGTLAPRDYTFGAFVNDAYNDTGARNAIYTHAIPELLRPTIRQALQTWSNNLATVQSFGAGCGSPIFTQSNSSGNLPRLGTTMSYRGESGHANSLVLLGVGFSSVSWNGLALPANLVSLGGEAGCRAFNDVLSTHAAIADGAGRRTFTIGIPNNTGLLGLRYLTQLYSFGGTTFKSSNGFRTTIGL